MNIKILLFKTPFSVQFSVVGGGVALTAAGALAATSFVNPIAPVVGILGGAAPIAPIVGGILGGGAAPLGALAVGGAALAAGGGIMMVTQELCLGEF